MKILEKLMKIIKWCFYAILIAILAAMIIRFSYYVYTKTIGSEGVQSDNPVYNNVTNTTAGTLENIRSGKAFSFKLPPPGSWSFNLSDPNRPIDWEGQEPSWDSSAGWSSEADWNTSSEGWDSEIKWDTQQNWPAAKDNNGTWNYDNTLDYKKPTK